MRSIFPAKALNLLLNDLKTCMLLVLLVNIKPNDRSVIDCVVSDALKKVSQ